MGVWLSDELRTLHGCNRCRLFFCFPTNLVKRLLVSPERVQFGDFRALESVTLVDL